MAKLFLLAFLFSLGCEGPPGPAGPEGPPGKAALEETFTGIVVVQATLTDEYWRTSEEGEYSGHWIIQDPRITPSAVLQILRTKTYEDGSEHTEQIMDSCEVKHGKIEIRDWVQVHFDHSGHMTLVPRQFENNRITAFVAYTDLEGIEARVDDQ